MSWGKWLKPLVLFILLLLAWEAVVRVLSLPSFLLPAPSAVFAKLYELRGRLFNHTQVTLYIVLAGFTLAVMVGVVMAALIAHSRLLAESLYPLLVIQQVTPQVAIAPLLVIWFGHTDVPKILIAFLVALFPMVVNTTAGLLRVDPDLVDMMRGLRASRWRIFLMIRVPNALPYIFAGMRISITLAVIGAVVGEFVAGDRGLGYVVTTGTANTDTALTFAAITILATMGISLFWIIGMLRRLALPWAPDSENES